MPFLDVITNSFHQLNFSIPSEVLKKLSKFWNQSIWWIKLGKVIQFGMSSNKLIKGLFYNNPKEIIANLRNYNLLKENDL